MPIARRKALIAGRVQGVGFRATTRRMAGDFAVAGTVRNLDDGRVEVVAEGEPGEISAFLAAIRREWGDSIRGVDVSELPPGDPPLEGFRVVP